jgi:hypothetical protein
MEMADSNSSPMRVIGYWIESLLDASYLPPQEFVGSLAGADRKALAGYLDQGDVYETYRGLSWCRFYCGREMGCREFTDGHWVWPEDLSHYVREHGVVLPQEFMQHARIGVSRISRPTWSERSVDATFWKIWCRENSLGLYRERIVQARVQSDHEAERIIASILALRNVEVGISSIRCQWVNCVEFALNGRAFCARCEMRGQDPNWRTLGCYYDLRKVLIG